MDSPHFERGKVLIVDDEAAIRGLLDELLHEHGFEPTQAANGESALAIFRRQTPDLVLLDISMPGMDGLCVLRELKDLDGQVPIIMVTGYASIRSAVAAVQMGAYDYVTKPFANDELVLAIARAMESRHLSQENQRLRRQVRDRSDLAEQMGSSDLIRHLILDVERVAPTDYTVIISGETGSGKELVARAIHQQSPRGTRPFVPVDCGAIQPTLIETELFGHEKGSFTGADRSRIGKFEAAAGGTIFLDEVQNLPLTVQTKFLRALQEKEIWPVGGFRSTGIDIRIVAATNQDLPTLVQAGLFRQDLYHRLNEFQIRVPALRERLDDLIYLAKRFLDATCRELNKEFPAVSPEALDALLACSWPGNVRELRNVIRRAALMTDGVIRPSDLGIPGRPAPPSPTAATGQPSHAVIQGDLSLKEMVRRSLAEVEREVLVQALKQAGGNKAKAARLLQIDYKTVHTKAREYGLNLTKGTSGKRFDPEAWN